MASVWLEKRGVYSEKLAGHLPPAEVGSAFLKALARLAKVPGVKVTARTPLMAILTAPEFKEDVLLYIEPYSPPSAPEVGQPVVKNGAGILLHKDGGTTPIKLPETPKKKGTAK